MSRRTFMTVMGMGALASPSVAELASTRRLATTRGVKPVVVASRNGNRSKDAAGLTCITKAFHMLTAGADLLDALIAGVNIIELDPNDDSVGYGGLPNADGVVQLDAAVMHGQLKRAGAVACLEGVRTPSLVAKKVMEMTDHHLLAGEDAQRFARSQGFEIERDLNTEHSRRMWLEWKRGADRSPFLKPVGGAEVGIDPEHFHGTVNCIGVNAWGQVAGVTSTSGLAWKVPGRVGDSPILGAGLYVDGAIGAAGSTGHGEASMLSLGSFLIVELMRNGMSPRDAGLGAMKRVVANTVDPRLLNRRGTPNFNLRYYALNTKGEYAGLSLYELSDNGKRTDYAVCTEDGPRFERADFLLPGKPGD